MRAYFLFSVCALCANLSLGQVGANWILGDSMHLCFTDTGLQFKSEVNVRADEAISTISDSVGSLLFTATSFGVYNRDFELMPNGLFASSTGTSTQGTLILPIPESNDLYCVFYVDEQPTEQRRLLYSIVDITADGEKGDVTVKNRVVVPQRFSEQLEAVRHGNGEDWWIIGRILEDTSFDHSNTLITILLTSDTVKVVDTYECLMSRRFGEMAVSGTGDLLAIASVSPGGLVQVLEFDRCVGTIETAEVVLSEEMSSFYGCEFSPNSSKLYVSRTNAENVLQIDLSSGAVTEVFKGSFGPNNSAGQIELGQDGKIYWCMVKQASGLIEPASYLHRINSPNLPGLACDFDTFAVYLGGNINERLGLPNMVNYDLGPVPGGCDSTTAVTEAIVAEQSFTVTPSVADQIIQVKGLPPQLLSKQFRVIDVNGQTYKMGVFPSSRVLKVGDLIPGRYYLVVPGFRAEPFVVQR